MISTYLGLVAIVLSGDTFVDLSEYNVSETGLGGCEITGVVT